MVIAREIGSHSRQTQHHRVARRRRQQDASVAQRTSRLTGPEKHLREDKASAMIGRIFSDCCCKVGQVMFVEHAFTVATTLRD